jgi:F0F1-type ATP synthase assembly protein I
MPHDSTQPPQKPSWPETIRRVARYTNLGWTLVASIVLGLLAGWWADARFGTEPWLLILGACLGIVVGLYHFLIVVLRK